jgi:hypothetical protein
MRWWSWFCQPSPARGRQDEGLPYRAQPWERLAVNDRETARGMTDDEIGYLLAVLVQRCGRRRGWQRGDEKEPCG